MLVIVPSRGRPDNVDDLIKSFSLTRRYASLLVVVDDDDDMLDTYVARSETYPTWAALSVTPRQRLGPTLNDYAVRHAPLYDIIAFMGDDHRPRSPRWDERFATSIARMGGVGLAYGNDLIQGQNLPTAVWMSSCIVEALGYMVPPGMTHLYLDDFWKALGQRLQRLAYVHDVVIEHMHPVAGKAPWDDGYAEVNAGAMYENDGRVFQAYLRSHLNADVDKIMERCVLR